MIKSSKKNGFTLVELLAVIAILAILVIIAIPNVLDTYNESKKDIFLNTVRNLLTGAEQKFLEESIHNNKVSIFASNSDLIDIANDSLQAGEPSKKGVELNNTGKKIDYYIEVDSRGKPSRYIFTDGEYSIFSVQQKADITKEEIILGDINIIDYVREFNIRGPLITTGNTYTREALDFDFKASDLIGKGANGKNLNTWTSKSGDVTGTIYKYDPTGPSITPISNPIFKDGALVLAGREAIRFNANFNYDDISYENSSSYGSFTLESTINFDKFYPYPEYYTNIISNIESGGYYLNVYSSKTGSNTGKPGIGIYLDGTYKQCTIDETISVNETHVLAASFNLKTKTAKVYLDGNLKKTCDFDDNMVFKYPDKKLNVPLSVGGNPGGDGSYFTDREWVYGKVYTARIYQGVMSNKDIYMNYLSNYIYANNLSEDSSVIYLNSYDETVSIKKYQYSLDKGNTWIDYDKNKAPLITEDTLVYARAISSLGVVSPISYKMVYVD